MNDPDRIPKIIARGKTHFIVTRGMLGWGLLTGAVFVGVKYLLQRTIHPAETVLAFILFPIGGIFWGSCMWARIKRGYDDRGGGQ